MPPVPAMASSFAIMNYLLIMPYLQIIPIHWMNDPSLIYPLTIDPLVTSSATYSSGSMEFRFNGEWCSMTTNNCIYSLTVTKPANCTITGATFAAEYRSVVGAGGCGACWMSDAGFYMEGPAADLPFRPFLELQSGINRHLFSLRLRYG